MSVSANVLLIYVFLIDFGWQISSVAQRNEISELRYKTQHYKIASLLGFLASLWDLLTIRKIQNISIIVKSRWISWLFDVKDEESALMMLLKQREGTTRTLFAFDFLHFCLFRHLWPDRIWMFFSIPTFLKWLKNEPEEKSWPFCISETNHLKTRGHI